MELIPSKDTEAVAKPTAEQIEQWKKQYGKAFEVTVGENTYYLGMPTRSKYKYFIDRVNKSLLDAAEGLVADCLLWPTTEEYVRQKAANPALPITLATALQEAFGGNEQPVAKNL
jgi:hypothetical protein